MKGKIQKIMARQVFTTKNQPSVEVDVILDDGSLGRAAAPSGTSRGGGEPKDLLDGDSSYFKGTGVNSAIQIVGEIIEPALQGKSAYDQMDIDSTLINLDGTPDRSYLGGNCIIATSIACAKAAAISKKMQFCEYFGDGNLIPLPFIYVMFGGSAFVGNAGISDFQEFALIPLKAKSYLDGYVSSLNIYQKLVIFLHSKNHMPTANYPKITGIPIAKFTSNEESFEILTNLIQEAGFRPGEDFGIYTDFAANQFYREGKYHLKADNTILSREEWIDKLVSMCRTYPIVSMEDCLYENDWEGWKMLTDQLGSQVQLVGDDLFVTNPDRLKKGIDAGIANALVIKPNQVGTLTETFEAISIAKNAGYGTVISPRSGELWDPYLTHLCVGQNLGQGKIVGAYASGEANLNELLRINDFLGKRAKQANRSVLKKSK